MWEQEDFLENQDKTQSDLDFFAELELAFLRNETDRRDRFKGRQGRSKENRQKARSTKKENEDLTVDYCPNQCPNCDGNEWIEDYRSGDVVCAECGRVESERGLGLSVNFNYRTKVKSKPYQKVVHFRQRMAQLLGRDPDIKEEIWAPLEEEIKRTMTKEEIERMGKKKFAEVLKRLNLPGTKRLSANWIQARRRLNCFELPHEVDDLTGLYKRLCARYSCVSNVFRETLYSPKGERPKENLLERRNILNVNYVTLQILRMESEPVWKVWAKYFPQLVSRKQPQKNNQRWKIIVEICKKRYPRYGHPRTEEEIFFEWNYIEFTREEINKHCTFFD